MKKETTKKENATESISFTNAYFESANGDIFEKVFGIDFGDGQANYWLARIKDKAISGNRWFTVARDKLLDKYAQRHPTTGEKMQGPRGQITIDPKKNSEYAEQMQNLLSMKVEGFDSVYKVRIYQSKLPRMLVPNELHLLLPFIDIVFDGPPKGSDNPPAPPE